MSMMLVHLGPLHVPKIERHTLPYPLECLPTYKLGCILTLFLEI